MSGGAQGIGEAITKMLANNGAAVMVFDMNEEKAASLVDILKGDGHTVYSCKVDVSNEGSVSEGFQFFLTKFQQLDIMVNCAGIVGPNAITTDSVSVKEFDKVYEGIYFYFYYE